MNIEHIANAWRDDEYRANLDEAARETLPASPIGEIDLSDTELEEIAGGEATSGWCISIITTLSVIYCASIIAGGTCANDSSGCCKQTL